MSATHWDASNDRLFTLSRDGEEKEEDLLETTEASYKLNGTGRASTTGRAPANGQNGAVKRTASTDRVNEA